MVEPPAEEPKAGNYPPGQGDVPIISGSMNSTNTSGDDFIVTIDLEDADEQFAEYWERIYVPGHIKQKLINYSELDQQLAGRVDRLTFNRHGAVLLVGPPGTGKTSLVKGAAHEIAIRREQRTLFQRIRIQKLFSSGFGDTPELVDEAFEEILEIATHGDAYQVVLIDEVESLFSERAMLAGDTDPMDAVRAVNRALERLDELATYRDVFVIATSNQPGAVDSAFADRTDDQLHVGVPAEAQRAEIFVDMFSRLNEAFGTRLPTAEAGLRRLVRLSEGLSGRRIRKLVYTALASSGETAADPGQLTYQQVCEEFERKRETLGDQDQDDDEEPPGDHADEGAGTPETAGRAAGTGRPAATPPGTERTHREPETDDTQNSRERESTGATSGHGASSPANEMRTPETGDGSTTGDKVVDGQTDSREPAGGESSTGHGSRPSQDGNGASDPAGNGADTRETPDDEPGQEPARFSRQVVFDSTVRAPHLALRDEIQEFIDETLAAGGYPDKEDEGLLDTVETEELLYELCMGRRLDRITVTAGDLELDLEVVFDHEGRSNLRVPSSEAVPDVPPDTTIQYTFVLWDDRDPPSGELPDVPGTEIEFESRVTE